MPIQSVAAQGVAGSVDLDPSYADGLRDLQGFSHLWLLYHLHQSERSSLTVTPFLDDQPRGVFATRSPKHPNAIGISIVQLVRIDGSRLEIEDVDMLDGTPLLDIKPYVPQFDNRADASLGWFAKNIHRVNDIRAGDRSLRQGSEEAK